MPERRSMPALPAQVLRFRYVVLVVFVAGLAATVYMYTHVPSAFVPTEDQGYLMCIVQAPPGASLSYTSDVARRAVKIMTADKDVEGAFAVMGFSLSGGSSSNYGLIFVPLKSIDKRAKKVPATPRPTFCKGSPQSSSACREALVAMFEPPAIQGIGTFGGFQFELQATGQNSLY